MFYIRICGVFFNKCWRLEVFFATFSSAVNVLSLAELKGTLGLTQIGCYKVVFFLSVTVGMSLGCHL